MTEILVTPVLEEALKQFSEKIAKKLTEGKRLTDTEVIVLLLDQMNKRIDAINESLNRRIDDLRDSLNERINETNRRIDETNKRIDELRDDVKLLYQEVSSIKSDIINLMKEKILK
ncbi:MAG: hypothetical protein C0200_01580 [Thermoproteota archaeon]|nr:MAG: hypothetical protein C0200_01580 [Candidatus Korarchaeota archaeon]